MIEILKHWVFYLNHFKITNRAGEILIIGTSKWCVIDTIARRLQRTDYVTYCGEVCQDINYPDKFLKIALPNEEPIHKFSYVVRFSDLDHNQHMNNTNYANLIANATENKKFSHFEINFLNEIFKINQDFYDTFINT